MILQCLRSELVLRKLVAFAALLLLPITVQAAEISPPQKAVLDSYVAAAKSEGSAEPSAARGRAFFFATHTGGKPDSASCTACHGSDLSRAGQTRAGKAIEPMAPSLVPSRYSDAAMWKNGSNAIAAMCSAVNARRPKRPTRSLFSLDSERRI